MNMPVSIIIIVLFAALLHALWNFLVKRMEDKYLSMSAVVLGHMPFAVAALIYSPLPDPGSVPYLLGGAALHVGYQLFLLNSYRLGDLSQVYPLARGVAPLLVAVFSIVVLGAKFSWLQLLAILMIGTGIMSLSAVRRSDNLRNACAASLALATGGFIASYSLVDGLGAREAGTALGFYGWLSTINGLLFASIMRFVQPGIVSRVVCRSWGFSLFGGGVSFAAYAMVTWAFTQAPIALVTALRETSIIFALILGISFLKERVDLMKIFAVLLTVSGVVMLHVN